MIYQGFDVVCQIFVLLTGGASFDVFHYSWVCSGPVVFFVDVSYGFISPGVSVDCSVMPYVHQFTFQPLIWGYHKVLPLDVPLEWFVQVVNPLNRVSVLPFFHQHMIMVLDDGYGVFN
jgi:hypothetical protein